MAPTKHGISDTFPRTGLALPEHADRSANWLVEFAVSAANAGFESIWAPEAWGYNPFTLLGQIAAKTDCALGTCIANAFARSPAALATGSLTLHDATDGQFILGIGASTPTVVEGFHGESFERPLRRIREIIEILDVALSGDRVDYDGEIFQLEGFTLEHASGVNVPVLNAALGTTNMAMTIDHADGLLPHLLPLQAIDDALAKAQQRASHDRQPHVAPSIPTAVSEDDQQARDVLSGHIAYYVGSADFYSDVIADHGFPEEASAIRDAWRKGDHSEAADRVTPDLVDAVGIAGTPEYARRRVRDLLNGPADTAIISFPRNVPDEMLEATIDALPPRLD